MEEETIDIIEKEECENEAGEIEPLINLDPGLTYNEFFWKCLRANRPCLFRSGLMENWPSKKRWRMPENAPNFELLRELFGTSSAIVVDCTKTIQLMDSGKAKTMNINDYLDYWIDYRRSGYSKDMPLLYLKDWHCMIENPNVPVYEIPKYFASDWVNEYYVSSSSTFGDYKFVYMGPKGSGTAFHMDVFGSYSWSANIVGKKLWHIFPPGEETRLPNADGYFLYDSSTDEEDTLSRIPTYQKHDLSSIKRYEIIQEAGEIVFIPSGWYHQVWNLEDTISLSHNWINSCNIWMVWLGLKKEMAAVRMTILEFVDDWTDIERALKFSHGMNYHEFWRFLLYIAEIRLSHLRISVSLTFFQKWKLGRNHCLFDLCQIKRVLEDLLHDAMDTSMYPHVFEPDKPENLLHRINEVL
ncbi:jmjC domain-containing protein 4 [Cephus cinctus]|uniref:Jumonji domain-containing protein 4 n=1 Tax=Cephus cinctus TaxID=211228 RepID=A0AAJ7C2N1_CEPCN|nr:jmjC domain-containing protein 4 [Cephus cinctus]